MDDTRLAFTQRGYPTCPHCHQRIINPGGHAERCHGPVEPPCECPPGWMHQPDCELVRDEPETA